MQGFLVSSQDTSHLRLSQFWYNHASLRDARGGHRAICQRVRAAKGAFHHAYNPLGTIPPRALSGYVTELSRSLGF